MRGRRLMGVAAIAVALAVIILFVLAWLNAGTSPVSDIRMAIPVPELPR